MIVLVWFSTLANFGISLLAFVFSTRDLEFSADEQAPILALVIIDASMTSWHMKQRVLDKLKDNLRNNTISDVFTASNLCLSCTHTHAATAGSQEAYLYQLSHFGFIEDLVENIADGIAGSILDAYYSMKPSILETNSGVCYGVSINRSPSAYDQNPEEEKSLYKENVDVDMFMLKFSTITSSVPSPTGMIRWLPVHPVCLPFENEFISGDNKGLAAYYFERWMTQRISNTTYIPPSSKLGTSFLAAFAQAGNEGDVTPNIIPAMCDEPDNPERNGRTCNVNPRVCTFNDVCKGHGPGKDAWEWLETNAKIQFQAAKNLFEATNATSLPCSGVGSAPALHHMHLYWNMTLAVSCSPAYGVNVVSGTTDGPGPEISGIWQGSEDPGAFISRVLIGIASLLYSKEQEQCQAPKPILLDFQTLHRLTSYTLTHDHLELQIFQIGSIFILACPVELTTMAGRRLKKAILSIIHKHYLSSNIEPSSLTQIKVILTGLANQYSGYMTTSEEYQIQRYEGASTLWGPDALKGLIMGYEHLIRLFLVETATTMSKA